MMITSPTLFSKTAFTEYRFCALGSKHISKPFACMNSPIILLKYPRASCRIRVFKWNGSTVSEPLSYIAFISVMPPNHHHSSEFQTNTQLQMANKRCYCYTSSDFEVVGLLNQIRDHFLGCTKTMLGNRQHG